MVRTVANEEPGFRASLDQTAVLEFEIGLDRSGHAYLMLPAGAPNGWNTIAGAEHPIFNQISEAGGDPCIERFAALPGGSSRDRHVRFSVQRREVKGQLQMVENRGGTDFS